MTREDMTTRMKSFLIQRGRANGIDFSPISQINSADNKLVGCVTANRRQFAPRQILRASFGDRIRELEASGTKLPEGL